MRSLLIANRGEIAIRVMRAAAELGLRTVGVFSEDDAQSLHTRRANESRRLRGRGATAYLDGRQIISVAKEARCDAIHPGYGFLSENADFARQCGDAGIVFVGPRPEVLSLFGDKLEARSLAARCGVPVLPGIAVSDPQQAQEFLRSLDAKSLEAGAAIMIKAVAGGGGRGIRLVRDAGELDEALARCHSEAQSSFGNGDLYVERFISRARHVEVQIVGDDAGNISQLWERECSVQRRHQKLVEIAPAPNLSAALRNSLTAAALRLAREVRYSSLGTFEFLIGAENSGQPEFAFIEANPRLQVEHTVTEEVLGIDLVKIQLQLASGRTLAQLGLEQPQVPEPRGFAIQARINLESLGEDGRVRPSGGTLAAFEAPSGPGVRVDSFAYTGYTTNPNFDSLLAKLIVHSSSSDFANSVQRLYRALCEFRIEGVATNLSLLQNLTQHPEFVAGKIHTQFVEDHLPELVGGRGRSHQQLFFTSEASLGSTPPRSAGVRAGAKIDGSDPLAVLAYGKQGDNGGSRSSQVMPENTVAISAPMQGTIISIDIKEGELIHKGRQVAVMEAMKMEHVIHAHISGVVQRVEVVRGDAVFEGHALALVQETDVEAIAADEVRTIDLDHVRPDLAEVYQRHEIGLDAARPEAVERRRKTRQRTARENIADLCDPGTYVEYGVLVVAAQRKRRELDDLIRNTPADGLVAGIGRVNGDLFGESKSRCVLMSYDYTVLAGTQGKQNHHKKDRMFELAEKSRLPVIFFTEGGGGRPGDTDGLGVSGLDCRAFALWAELSGLVPLIGINSGRCFAGNAALLGCCDVVIATQDSNIGMGGPAMIEGGGLGIFRPEEIGPIEIQRANGVVDVAVADEAEAVRVAKQYLSYFQGPIQSWECADQRLLRASVPENRLRIYDVRTVIETLADTDSVLELRRGFGLGMVTVLARVEGRPIGIIANNPGHLAGAIDSPGADKAARFMQLCDAFDVPILFLCDCPGIMVGPEAEKTALVRHASRMFVTGASLTIPFFTIILRKGYGLGAQAMAGGGFKAPFFTVAWPTGEFGGMGLEGAVKLGYRKELAAIEDPAARKALFEKMVAKMYEHGKAVSVASHFEIDDVIDPAESRKWIVTALESAPPPAPRAGKKRSCIDCW
ncbi:MAG TPA: carboxyl transferase domain-containing protein [Candidatus Angelobacter sp.]|jgi:acetyl/propionyl-CoA carboxylase alpha subunit/acetyl-CoA carboxylase carboxyltransferase component|nr:carboxyl transferase domain-containing protein [Candidatus Angelobacter sp.]